MREVGSRAVQCTQFKKNSPGLRRNLYAVETMTSEKSRQSSVDLDVGNRIQHSITLKCDEQMSVEFHLLRVR
jgi:hypothetical protein